MIVKLKRTEGGWREGRLQATQTPEKEAAGGRKGHKLQRIPLFPKTSVLLTGGETLGCFFLLFLSFSIYWTKVIEVDLLSLPPSLPLSSQPWIEKNMSQHPTESRGNEGDVCGRVSLLLKTPFLFWGVDWHKKSLKHNFPGNSSHLETSLALPRRASIFLDCVHAPAATTVLEMKYGAGRQSCYYFTFHCASSF